MHACGATLDGLGQLLAAARASFEHEDGGGHLQPSLCGQGARRGAGFAALLGESEQTGQHWDSVFVASL